MQAEPTSWISELYIDNVKDSYKNKSVLTNCHGISSRSSQSQQDLIFYHKIQRKWGNQEKWVMEHTKQEKRSMQYLSSTLG